MFLSRALYRPILSTGLIKMSHPGIGSAIPKIFMKNFSQNIDPKTEGKSTITTVIQTKSGSFTKTLFGTLFNFTQKQLPENTQLQKIIETNDLSGLKELKKTFSPEKWELFVYEGLKKFMESMTVSQAFDFVKTFNPLDYELTDKTLLKQLAITLAKHEHGPFYLKDIREKFGIKEDSLLKEVVLATIFEGKVLSLVEYAGRYVQDIGIDNLDVIDEIIQELEEKRGSAFPDFMLNKGITKLKLFKNPPPMPDITGCRPDSCEHLTAAWKNKDYVR